MKNFTLALFGIFIFSSSYSQILNAGFEFGPGASPVNGWVETSTNFPTLMCDLATCGDCGGECQPQAGAWYAWFGGAGENLEVGSMGQDITIPNGTAGTLSFYVKVAAQGSTPDQDGVIVSLDGTELFAILASDSADYGPEYTLITKNINAYTDGGQHTLEMDAIATGGSNILFDSFSMSVDGTPVVGVNEVLNHEAKMVVYPNPANNMINLQFNGRFNDSAVVKIYDLNGSLVSTEKIMEISNKLFSMDASAFAAGIYNIEVVTGNNVMRERLTIVH